MKYNNKEENLITKIKKAFGPCQECEKPTKKSKFMRTVLKYLGLGTCGYLFYTFGKEVSKVEIRNALMNCDFIADFGKKPITMGINSLDDIVDNTILLFPKK